MHRVSLKQQYSKITISFFMKSILSEKLLDYYLLKMQPVLTSK